MATKNLERMETTKISRRACYMMPDPCPEDDYVICGEDVYGSQFERIVHHRGPRCWLVEDDGLRQTWIRFSSLQEAIYWLEGAR